jgi:hypothetical protein
MALSMLGTFLCTLVMAQPPRLRNGLRPTRGLPGATTQELSVSANKPVDPPLASVRANLSEPPADPPITVATEEEKNQKIATDWQNPWLVFYITGNQYGYLEPCGCTGLANQKGGINR